MATSSFLEIKIRREKRVKYVVIDRKKPNYGR